MESNSIFEQFSEPKNVYKLPDYDLYKHLVPSMFCYAGKDHSIFNFEEFIVVTYACNGDLFGP